MSSLSRLSKVAATAALLLPVVRAESETPSGPPSPLVAILNFFTPQLFEFPQEQYDGFEIRYGRFVFRPALFFYEGIILAFVLVYLFVYLYMAWYNKHVAQKWFKANKPLYATQFSRPGDASMILDDGASDMFAYSTGRRNVQSLHTVFTFLPRHDLFQLIFTYAWTLYDLRYTPDNEVTLDFKLGTNGTHPAGNAPAFIWAIVEKEELIGLKSKRWDLTMTKSQDNAHVPKSCIVMSEVADVTDTILKSPAAAALLSALNDPKVMRHFKSISITDLPHIRPTKPLRQKERHLILSLKIPSGSQMEDTIPLIKAAFGLIDWVEGKHIGLRPETLKKLKVARDDLDKELLKDATAEKTQEAEESKRTAKKKAEEERMAKLSAEQQRKVMEKEKKKAMRKNTTKVRMG